MQQLWSWSVHTGDPLFADAAKEIERLRNLIIAWADVDAEWRASRKSRGSELGMRLTEIEDALRKAIGQ